VLRWGLGAAAGITACNRNTKKIIAVVAQGRTHLFWQSIHAGAVAAAREGGVEIQWSPPATETDYNGQLQIVDAMINRRVDALCLSPIDSKALVRAVEDAAKLGIPVVIFDSGLETEAYASWVATDNYAAGKLAADRIAQICGGKGSVAIVAGVPGVASTTAREQGFEEQLRTAHPGVQIADKRYGYSDFAKSMAIAENILTALPKLDSLFAINEGATVGTVQAVKSRQSKVRLVGFDWSPALIDELKAGTVDSLVAQDPFQIGYQSVRAALQALRKEPVEKVKKLAPRLLTAQDLTLPDVQKLLNPDLKRYLD
jgi:ribose transport system substrate-binding protein